MTNKERYKSIEHKLPLFFKTWWLDAFCAGSWEVALSETNHEITGVWPYQLEQKMGFKIIRNPLLTPYLGPYLLSDEQQKSGLQLLDWEEEQLKSLLAQLPANDYLQFATVPRFTHFLPLHQAGISNTNRLTYYIDLYNEQEVLLENVQKRRRRYIRNAGDALRIVDAPPYMDQFFSIHKETFEKKRAAYPYSISFFQKILFATEQHESSRFFAAVDAQDRLCAALWVVFDDQKMYQLLSCFPMSNEQPNAMTLLTWHAIMEAKKMGLKTFDFEGSIDKGIEQFFRKFGGERVLYLSFERYQSRLWKLKRTLLG